MNFDGLVDAMSRELDSMFVPTEFQTKLPKKPILMELELAGVKKESIVLTYDGDVMHVNYVSRKGKEEQLRFLVRAAFYDRAKTVCDFVDGLLTIRVPLLPKNKEPEIRVKVL